MEVLGSATGDGFVSYVVEYGAGATPTAWIRIGDVVNEPRERARLAIVDTIQLADGPYQLRLTIERTGGLREMVYRRFVADNSAPSIALAGLVPNATLPRGQAAFEVAASDDTRVSSVTYEIDGAFAGASRTAPYTIAWDAVPGQHRIKAVAQDSAGNFAETEVIAFSVP